MTRTQYRFNADFLGVENLEGDDINVLSLLLFLSQHCFNWDLVFMWDEN